MAKVAEAYLTPPQSSKMDKFPNLSILDVCGGILAMHLSSTSRIFCPNEPPSRNCKHPVSLTTK